MVLAKSKKLFSKSAFQLNSTFFIWANSSLIITKHLILYLTISAFEIFRYVGLGSYSPKGFGVYKSCDSCMLFQKGLVSQTPVLKIHISFYFGKREGCRKKLCYQRLVIKNKTFSIFTGGSVKWYKLFIELIEIISCIYWPIPKIRTLWNNISIYKKFQI